MGKKQVEGAPSVCWTHAPVTGKHAKTRADAQQARVPPTNLVRVDQLRLLLARLEVDPVVQARGHLLALLDLLELTRCLEDGR